MNKRLIALLTFPLVFSLAGCKDKTQHVHTFASDWTSNEITHWHKATCEHTDLKANEANHSGGVATYEHGKICEVCGFEYTEPIQVDKDLFDKLYTYNGKSSDLRYDKGTSQEDFLKTLPKFFGSFVDIKINVANILSSYRVSRNHYETIYNKQTKFESKQTELIRSFDGKEVRTYDVNIKNDYKLCQFGLDPNLENVYHFYLDKEESISEIEIFKLIDRDIMSGHKQNVKVYDDGFKLVNNEVIITFVVDLSYDDVSYKASFDFTLEKEAKQTVKITKQPQNLTITAPEGFMFEVEVDHPEFVESYQWYAGSFDDEGNPSALSPLGGSKAKLPKYEVPGTGSATALFSFTCLITTAESQFFSDVAYLNVQSADDEIPALMVLDYPVIPGSTLNLEDTPYGYGTISYSLDGTKVTFDNIDFDNTNIDSSFSSICFEMTSWHNTVENVEFNFIGDNVVNNTYWEDVHNQGGFGFFMHYAGISILPTVTFSGGNLTIKGGTRALTVNTHLVIKNNITCIGKENRLTHGIYAFDIVIDNNASITADIGGSILYTTHADGNVWGNITIKEGAKVKATIKPGHVSVGETQLFGMLAINELNIEKADINIKIIPDYKFFYEFGSGLAPIIGLYSERYLIKISNSNIKIDISCSNTSGESKLDTVALCAQGISSPNVQILNNSNVDIRIDSSAFVQVCGVYGIVINFFDSEVNIYAHGAFYVSGVNAVLKRLQQATNLEAYYVGKCYGSDYFNVYADEKASFDEIDFEGNILSASKDYVSTLKINEGNTKVYAEADYVVLDPVENHKTYVDAGMRAKDLKLTLNGESSIEVETKNMSVLVVTYDHVQNYLEPYIGYSSLYLDQVLDVFDTSNTYYVNQNSYESYSESEEVKHFFVACESLYEDDKGESYLTHIKLTPKA